MNILQEADSIIGDGKDRSSKYGPPSLESEAMAKVIEGITRQPFKPEHWPLVMVGLKLVRESYRHGRDNLVDIAGYARCAEKGWDERDETADARKAIGESGLYTRRCVCGERIETRNIDLFADWCFAHGYDCS